MAHSNAAVKQWLKSGRIESLEFEPKSSSYLNSCFHLFFYLINPLTFVCGCQVLRKKEDGHVGPSLCPCTPVPLHGTDRRRFHRAKLFLSQSLTSKVTTSPFSPRHHGRRWFLFIRYYTLRKHLLNEISCYSFGNCHRGFSAARRNCKSGHTCVHMQCLFSAEPRIILHVRIARLSS